MPGFAIFRSGFYKFGPAVWFSIIVIFSCGINFILLRYIKSKNAFTFLEILLIGFILIYHFPFFTTDFFTWNKPFSTKIAVPKYVYEMSDYINSNSASSSRILLLPLFDKVSGADSTNFGYWSLDPLPELSINRSIIARSDSSLGVPEKIYKAISTGTREDFLYLTGVYGIDKILWRDDLLYADKKTNSGDFVDIKKKLESYPDIKLEKKFGSWTLYSISSPYSAALFYAPSNIIQSNLTLDEVLNSDISSGKSVIVPLQNDSSSLSDAEEQVTKVSCIKCKSEYGKTNDAFSIITDRAVFYPDSILYPLISINEQFQLRKARANPTALGYLYLAFSNKRLGEINGISQRQQNSRSQDLINKNISLYKREIDSAILQADKLDMMDRNNYYVNLLGYLDEEKQYITSLPVKLNLSNDQYSSLISFIEQKRKYLLSVAWITESPDKLRYEFSLPQDTYQLNLSNNTVPAERILLDGREINLAETQFLKSGLHRVEIQYPPIANLVIDQDKALNNRLVLYNDDTKSFSIKDFNPKNTYGIYFEYKLDDGSPTSLSILQSSSTKPAQEIGVYSKRLNVDFNGYWHSFNYVFEPVYNLDTTAMRIGLVGDPTDTSVFEMRNMQINQISIPDLYFKRTLNSKQLTSPKLKITKINPAKYVIHISNAGNDYLIAFRQSFNNGWIAYANIDNKKIVFPHTTVNGYANGWYINQRGSYDIIVEYDPQKTADRGLMLSAAGIVLVGLCGLYRKKKYGHL